MLVLDDRQWYITYAWNKPLDQLVCNSSNGIINEKRNSNNKNWSEEKSELNFLSNQTAWKMSAVYESVMCAMWRCEVEEEAEQDVKPTTTETALQPTDSTSTRLCLITSLRAKFLGFFVSLQRHF